MDQDNKKPPQRKKNIDLKAVAAFLENPDEEGASVSPIRQATDSTEVFQPNEELLQNTSRIKNQRDLIRSRLIKMEQNRTQVSKNVYEKVYRDYSMQLGSVNHLLNEKKSLLKKELKNLYLLFEKKTLDINRHQEILEEARFRHVLEEFTEDQYKEVEEYESREIHSLQSELSQVQAYIRIHEELFDPEDLHMAPQAQESTPPQPAFHRQEPTRTMAEPRVMPPPEQKPVYTKTVFNEETRINPEIKSDPKPPVFNDEVSLSKPHAEALSKNLEPEEVEAIPENEGVQEKQEEVLVEEPSYQKGETLLPPLDEKNYFEPSITGQHKVDVPSEPSLTKREEVSISRIEKTDRLDASHLKPQEEEPEDKTLDKTEDKKEIEKEELNESTPLPSKIELGEDSQSVIDILDSLPLDEVSETNSRVSPHTNSGLQDSFGESRAVSGQAELKLVFTEADGPLDVNEFVLRDNVSIGRSPSNDIVFKAAKVSRQHAAINKFQDQYILIDLKSSNGVFVNGKKIDEHPLKVGDEISIGGYKMVLKKG